MVASQALAKKKKDKAGQRRRGADEGPRSVVDHLPPSSFGVGSAVGTETAKGVVGGEGARRCGNGEYEVCGRGCTTDRCRLCAVFVWPTVCINHLCLV